ncbi:hypothetical protein ACJX0J_020591, partial [Zea mays]
MILLYGHLFADSVSLRALQTILLWQSFIVACISLGQIIVSHNKKMWAYGRWKQQTNILLDQILLFLLNSLIIGDFLTPFVQNTYMLLLLTTGWDTAMALYSKLEYSQFEYTRLIDLSIVSLWYY